MSNPDESPLIGYQAMSEHIFGTPNKWRVIRTMCDARQLPYVQFGKQLGMWPSSYQRFREEQEAVNSANARKGAA